MRLQEQNLLNNVSEDVIRDRSIVMIQLSGGNDGLNSVIPKNQYDKYASIRPTIRIKESGTNAGIELDTTLGVQDQTFFIQIYKLLRSYGMKENSTSFMGLAIHN